MRAAVLILSQILGDFTSGVPIPAPEFPEKCTSEENCCMPYPYTGKPVRQFTIDPNLPLRIRRPVHKLNDDEIAKLEKGYQLLRSLSESDPRSLSNQAKLHCLYCDNGIYYPGMIWPLEIHNHWLFLPWHRMFLYFHERILAELLDDDSFALPYWNWDNQSEEEVANTLPDIYASNRSSSLWNHNRNKCAQQPNIVNLNTVGGCTEKTPTELRIENTRLMYTQIVSGAPTPRLFFGQAYSYGDGGGHGPGTFEDNPHGTVHLWVGDPDAPNKFDDMGNFGRAARDPIFYPHHANIDRIWTIWKTMPGKQRMEPNHTDFLDASFTYYDENADRVTVKVSQIINTTLLRYEYEESPTAWITNGQKAGYENSIPVCNPMNPSQTNAMIIATPELTIQDKLGAEPLTFRVPRPERSDVGVEVLEIEGIKVDGRFQSHWEAYLFFPSVDINTPVSCPEFFGTFNFVPHVGQAQFNRDRVWRVAVKDKLVALGKDNYTDIIVTLVQFGPNVQPLGIGKARIVYDASPATLE